MKEDKSNLDEIFIKPKEKIENKKVELSIFDGYFLNMKFVYIYEGNICLESFKSSLSSTLFLYPFIGGKIIENDNNYYIDISDPTIRLILCYDNMVNIDTLLDNNSLFVVVLTKCDINIYKMEIYINHVIGDGKTINNILETWSNIYENKYENNDIILDRYKLINDYIKIKDIKDNPNFNLYKLFDWKKASYINDDNNLINCKFIFDKNEISILKEISKSYSSLDSLSAYLYVIFNNIEQSFKRISTTIDFRKIVEINENTIGNYAILINTEKNEYKTNNKNQYLQHTSKLIRESINKVNKKLIEEIGENIENNRRKGNFKKYIPNSDNDCFITDSWVSLNLNNINFGLKIKQFVPPRLPIPYFTIYMKSENGILANVLIPHHWEDKIKNIINNDKKTLFEKYLN
jgi:Transferase family